WRQRGAATGSPRAAGRRWPTPVSPRRTACLPVSPRRTARRPVACRSCWVRRGGPCRARCAGRPTPWRSPGSARRPAVRCGGAPRIGVREVPDGLFSPWLVHDLRPGDEIDVATPTGTFTPDVAVAGSHVLVAAGSGITPVLSIAASLLRNPDTDVTLLYGNRR